MIRPVVVTLYHLTAAWCAPSRSMNHVFRTLASQYAGRLEIVEIDVDKDPATAKQFNVLSLPTYVLMREGREVDRFTGPRSREFVIGVLDRATAND